YARVIAGELGDARGPARTFTPVNVFDVRLIAGQRVELAVPAGHRGGLVLLSGDVLVNDATPLAGQAQLALLGSAGSGIVVEARADSTLLLLSGEPIDEPVASYGPFVMNTEHELREAVEDYRAGRMGRLS